MDYDKLEDLDYTAFAHAENFEQLLEDTELENPFIKTYKRIEDGVPVVEAMAEDDGDIYVESYRLEDVTVEEFDEIVYNVWDTAFQDLNI